MNSIAALSFCTPGRPQPKNRIIGNPQKKSQEPHEVKTRKKKRRR